MQHRCLEMVQAQRAPIKRTRINRQRSEDIHRQMLLHKATIIQIMPTHKLQTVPIIRRQQIRIIPIIKDR